jgi:predicted permease
MESLIRDVRHGIRSLARVPGFTSVVLLVLALGIGGNTAIFSLVHGIVLRPLPFEESERLVFLQEWSTGFGETSVSMPDLLDWRDQNQVFEQIGAVRFTSYSLIDAGEPVRIRAAQISSDLLPTLRLSPTLGRVFTEGDDRPGAPRVTVLSEGLWNRRYGSDPNVIGQSLSLDGEQFTVIGVMADAFDVSPWGDNSELWVPIGLNLDLAQWQDRDSHRGTMAIARLRPGVSLERAQSDMDMIARRLEHQYPDSNTGMHVTVYPLRERLAREMRTALMVLLGAVGFVLLIACVNIANLLLARTTSSHREMAIRLALGAGRLRIISQRLTESMLLALTGGAIGLLVASWILEILPSILPENVPRIQDVALSHQVLLFTLGISVASGVLFGLVPAFRATPLDLASMLRGGGHSSRGSTPRPARVRMLAHWS